MAFGARTYSGQANRGVDRNVLIKRNDTGEVIQFGGRLKSDDFNDKDSVEEIEGVDNNGLVDHLRHPGGVTGQITVTRYNGDFEDFGKAMDALYYAGQAQVYCTITMTTNNGFDMSTDTDTFTQVVLSKLKSGPFQAKNAPGMSFTFDAQQRI